MTSRAWVFTLNNPDYVPDVELARAPAVRYFIFQEEIGDEGTNHIQGYVELSKPARLSGVRRLIPGAHWEVRRGTREQAKAYASKEETRVDGPYEGGEWGAGGAGRRNDLLEVQKALKAGATPLEVAEQFFGSWVRHNKAFDRYTSLLAGTNQRPRSPVEVRVYTGPTGVGKTYDAFAEFPNLYRKDNFNMWWDGYNGQLTVLIDEFKGQLPFTYLLGVLDQYPLSLQIKGSTINAVWTTVILTTNYDPGDWYESEKNEVPALLRRIHKIRVYRRRGEYEEVSGNVGGLDVYGQYLRIK